MILTEISKMNSGDEFVRRISIEAFLKERYKEKA
jgi:hypothetical protein